MTVKVAIDASSAAAGGGITYLRELLPRLLRRDDLELGPILIRDGVRSVEQMTAELPRVVTKSRWGARQKPWKSAVAEAGVDLVYAPTEVSFARYKQPLVLAVRNPTLNPDLLMEYPTRWKARQSMFRRLARISARRAQRHIAVSGYAAGLAVRHLGVPEGRVEVVYHGGPEPRAERDGTGVTKLLFVSNLYRYKNVHRLVEALAEMQGEWELTVAGEALEAEYGEQVEAVVRSHRLEGRVRLLGGVDRDRLDRLYRESDCLVWPSYAETFGHPLLEARSYGLPILAARAASNPEIAGDAAVYFDPFDIGDMRAALRTALENGAEAGPLPRSYSWDLCAEQTAQVLLKG